VRDELEIQQEHEKAFAMPTREERELCALVDAAIGERLTWDKREVGTVSYMGQHLAIRNLTLSQIAALLIERKRRSNAGESLEGIDKFLAEHGYEWRPWQPARQEAQAPHRRAERRGR
jgi:hypothetical protein